MRVLRSALLVSTLAILASPAIARPDLDEVPQVQSVIASPRAAAVQAALDAETDADDPIEKVVLEGVRAFYAGRNHEPIWFADTPAASMSALRSIMDRAAEYGLDPVAYRTPDPAAVDPADPADVGLAEDQFSRALARFVEHIAAGRMLPSSVSQLITLEPERPDIGSALAALAGSTDVAGDLARFEPPHPEYAALKTALAKLRASTDDAERIVIPDGEMLKPGATDPRIPLLRSRLSAVLPEGGVPEAYDDAVVEAVKAFQEQHDLTPDGIVGPRTLAVMNGRSREEEIASVVANLERWRWMPRDLGAFHVFVNVPEFMVRVRDHGAVTHETRVVVGKPTNPTPTFSNVMSHAIVNPYWNVPASIVKNEMLPEARGNPYYFVDGGYQVFARVGGRMRQIDPFWVNWDMVNASQVQIRQVPGDFNALGRIKFMFPNDHDVYLHDTPSKRLFQRDYRALSHGCVRVQNPLEFADAILPVTAPEWNSARLEKLYGGKERRVDFDHPIPVHLAYFTEAADPSGNLQHFEDIYGYDAKMAGAPAF